MSRLRTKLDELINSNDFSFQKVIGIMVEETKELEKTVVELEEGNQQKLLDIEIRDSEIMSLQYQIKKLEKRLIEASV